MNYEIRVIPHNQQRYDTVGDYYMKREQEMVFRISDFGGSFPPTEGIKKSFTQEDVRLVEAYEFLVMMHELTEAFLCRRDGVSILEIDNFDLHYEGTGEPGNAVDCPYRFQHQLATAIEKELANMMGIDWDKYDEAVNRLSLVEQEKSST